MKRTLVPLAAVLAVALPGATANAGGTSTTREFEGTVVSVNRDARTFRLRDDGRVVTIRVTRATSFERIAGFRALRAGMRRVEAQVRRSRGRWIARHVELSGRGRDRHGDEDNSGPG